MGRIIARGLTDIGKGRKENQDAFDFEEDSGIVIVADGVGGLKNGSFASRYVVSELRKNIKEKLIGSTNNQDVSLIIKKSICELSNSLRSLEEGNLGSTIVFALFFGQTVYMAHLGDSRAYLLRKRRLSRLTKDHTLASLLVDEGVLTSEEVLGHPLRNVLTKFVGMENAVPDVKTIHMESGDRLLLCTDGFSGTVPDDEIADILLESNDLHPVLKRIVSTAKEAGGNDNITAVLVDYYL